MSEPSSDAIVENATNGKEDSTTMNVEAIVEEKASAHDDDDVLSLPSSSIINHDHPTTDTAAVTEASGGDHNHAHRPFDTTHRKVVIHNVNKHMRPKEIENMISSWKPALLQANIKIEKFKKPQANYLNITLENESMAPAFVSIINSGQFTNKKGEKLFATKAQHRQERNDGDGRKHGRDVEDEINDGVGESNDMKKAKWETMVKTEDDVRDATAPLWRLPYDQQLDKKSRLMINKCLVSIMAETKNKFKKHPKDRNPKDEELYEWLRKGNKIVLEPILGASNHTKYRNKCEFTFGYLHTYEDDPESSEKIVTRVPSLGFMASGWSGGVSLPHCLPHVSDAMCGLVDLVHDFLQGSPIPPYDSRQHRGIWRIMTVRVSQRTKQCMVIIQHSPPTGGVGKLTDGSDDYSHVFESEKERLIHLLTEKDLPSPNRSMGIPELKSSGEDMDQKLSGLRVTSIFFQEYDGLSHPPPDHPVQHIYGKEFIEEELLNSLFRISPGAFFQVTTEGAEILYKVIVDKVKEVTLDPQNTLLFDVCCGTGTIGLTLLKEGAVGSVVGIDISVPAIKDAKINADKNGFGASNNAYFIASRAEHVMTQEIQKASEKTVIAVVDPAREGLHPDVIKAIRNSSVQRLVYVSCNPTASLVRDCGMLCSPPTTKNKGLPFKPTFAQPVDMFPHTDHCELIMVFDRMNPVECNNLSQK